MLNPLELPAGLNSWSLNIPAEKGIKLHRKSFQPTSQTPRELITAALEKPFGFEPMRRAVTPDDHVTVVLEDTLPHSSDLLAGVLGHLASAGISPAQVTVLTQTEVAGRKALGGTAAEYPGVQSVVHDPADRKQLAYLATTQGGRRIYLNRHLVDADFAVVLSARGFDPIRGYSGAEARHLPPP